MHVILETIAGPHTAKRVAIPSHLKGTVGRTEWADHQFPDDAMMSSQHFSLELVGRDWVVRDLGSTNGTYVDEQRVVEAKVVSGSIIRAGQTKVKVILSGGAGPRHTEAPRDAPAASPVVATALDVAASPAERAPGPQVSSRRIELASATQSYQGALGQADAGVRHSALWAAAWCGRRWVLEHCRSLCARPLPENWAALLLLAIVGEPADLELVLAVGRAEQLGPRRFQMLGAFGHPRVVNDLIVAIESPDAEVAVAAGRAFCKITGFDLGPSPAHDDANEDASDELVEAPAPPNGKAAASHWRNVKDKFSAGRRWLKGLEVSGGLSPSAADKLDLESRFEVCLRGRFQGIWQSTSFDREQLADCMANLSGEAAV